MRLQVLVERRNSPKNGSMAEYSQGCLVYPDLMKDNIGVAPRHLERVDVLADRVELRLKAGAISRTSRRYGNIACDTEDGGQTDLIIMGPGLGMFSFSERNKRFKFVAE